MSYQGAEGIYFAVQNRPSTGVENKSPFQPFTNVEFVKYTTNEATVDIKVMITGPSKTYDRTFKVEINPDSTTAQLGIHYEPLTTQLVVPANAFVAYVPVKLKRALDLQTQVKTLGLKLIPNEHFALAFPEWDAIPGYTSTSEPIVTKFNASLHTLRINDFIVQPAVWSGSIQPGNREAGPFGAFTRKKIELMFRLLNLTYDDFANSTIMPQVRINVIAQYCARYLIAQFNAGTPVLEDDGRLMFFDGVPWTSIIGVKYQ